MKQLKFKQRLANFALLGLISLLGAGHAYAAEFTVYDQGSSDSRWNRGINAFDSAIGWATCSNDGGAGCPSISWQTVNDGSRGNVLQISHSSAGNAAGLFIASDPAKNFNQYAGGNILFDIKVVSGNSNITMKIDCIYPCTSGDQFLGSKGASGWETVTVPVDTLVAGGLNLSQVDTGIVIWASNHTSTVFRIDNVRWETSGGDSGGGTVVTPGTPEPVDSAKWFHQTQLPNGGSWFNGEVQHYTNRLANSYVSNGTLKIVAKKETYTSQGHTKQYTSARLNSKYAFKYGRVVVRAKLPTGAGTWPAIWTLGKNINEPGAYWQTQGYGTTSWPYCGEIDIMEHWGHNQNYVQSAMHTPSSYGGTVNHGGRYISTVSSQFHNYEMDWNSERIIFRVDGIEHYRYAPEVKNSSTWPYNAEQFLLLNIAIEPTIISNFTQSAMEIDYVRIYAANAGPTDAPIWADEFNTASDIDDFDSDGIADEIDTDDDNDGVPDALDAFPMNANESVDTDGDGTGNNADTDDDNDGVADTADSFPLNPAESADTDGDGIGNNADTDDDNDTVLDALDSFPLDANESMDTDNDGIGNNADTDDDGDGVLDSLDSYPLDPNNQPQNFLDIDGDGNVGAMTDILIVMRYMFGFSGTALTKNAIAEGATRTNPADIEAYIDSLMP